MQPSSVPPLRKRIAQVGSCLSSMIDALDAHSEKAASGAVVFIRHPYLVSLRSAKLKGKFSGVDK